MAHAGIVRPDGSLLRTIVLEQRQPPPRNDWTQHKPPRLAIFLADDGHLVASLARWDHDRGWLHTLSFYDQNGTQTRVYAGKFAGDCSFVPAGTKGIVVIGTGRSNSSGPQAREALISCYTIEGQPVWERDVTDWSPMAIGASNNGSRVAAALARGSFADGSAQWRTAFYDKKGKLLGEAEAAATEMTFSPDAKHLAGLHDHDLALFNAEKGKLAWIKTLDVEGVRAPAEAVALANDFMAVIIRRPDKDKQGNPVTVRSIHLLDYTGKTLWREDFSTTPDGTDLGKPGVTMSPDATLMALWERNRVWTYRITRQ